MNLSTARAGTRLKEIGVRKIIGARKADREALIKATSLASTLEYNDWVLSSGGADGNFSTTLYIGNNTDPHQIETGIDNVFSGFDTSKIRFDDMQPFHIFSVNGTVGYYLTQNC